MAKLKTVYDAPEEIPDGFAELSHLDLFELGALG
jgi:hypothetical protein